MRGGETRFLAHPAGELARDERHEKKNGHGDDVGRIVDPKGMERLGEEVVVGEA
jgi:hypothetical protein